jgi:choline monooxygenase
MGTFFIPPALSQNDLEIVPIEKAETIPSSWYTDEDFCRFEKNFLFTSEWQYAGHLNQLKNVGDFILCSAAGNPIIIIRENKEKVNAFFNVCRHRGGPLAMENGNCKILQCKYHGWTYKLDGSLHGVPRFDRAELFDKKDFGLTPVAIDFWEGLIFIKLSSPVLTIHDQLSGIAERIFPNKISEKIYKKTVKYLVNSNWKIYVDNYLEGYHVPYVHPELAKLLDYREYKTETGSYYSLQHSPLKEEENFYGSGYAYYYFIFPNLMLNILPGRLQTNFVIPLSPDKCQVIFEYYYDDIASKKSLKIMEEDFSYSDKVQQEDIEICEQVQKGVESNAYDKGRFSVECEQGVYHFQTLLKNSYRKIIHDFKIHP